MPRAREFPGRVRARAGRLEPVPETRPAGRQAGRPAAEQAGTSQPGVCRGPGHRESTYVCLSGVTLWRGFDGVSLCDHSV